MVKIYNANFEITPMNLAQNAQKATAAIEKAVNGGCDLIVFPSAFLTGAPLGMLENAAWFKEEYNRHIQKICQSVLDKQIYILCDILTEHGFENRFFTNGKAIENKTLTVDNQKIFSFNSKEEFLKNKNSLTALGDICVLNFSIGFFAGQGYLLAELLKAINQKNHISFCVNCSAIGFTSHPYYYMPVKGAVCKGVQAIAYSYREVKNQKEIWEFEKADIIDFSASPLPSTEFEKAYTQNPLIPQNVPEKEYCLNLFDMQSASLAARLKNINCKNTVLNLSGGLDSTLALLVCVNTFDMLGLDKTGLNIITMPGFGTSIATKGLAYRLCESLGLNLETVDITSACTKALESINHKAETFDVTYENVQARMRTLNALNIANMKNAIMVGTGDLSEEALGFSTFGGDQLASYNVNCCVSKTVIRTMLPYITELPLLSGGKKVVEEILNIPVSPELIPHGGEILQKTEDILAPYKLIDFFIYCTLAAKISPKETAQKAFETFKGEFSKEYIKEKLSMFYRKYAIGQFKRSCSPECGKITHCALIGNETFYPSDASTTFMADGLNGFC